MKLILTLFLALTIQFSFASPPPNFIFGEYCSILLKASKINIYRIAPYPVLAIEQNPKLEYVFDYEILRRYAYKNKEVGDFPSVLIDSSQYIIDDARKCPFVGKYAAEFTKGKLTLTILFSLDPCFKMIIFNAGTPIDRTRYDIIDNSLIYQLLLALGNDKN